MSRRSHPNRYHNRKRLRVNSEGKICIAKLIVYHYSLLTDANTRINSSAIETGSSNLTGKLTFCNMYIHIHVHVCFPCYTPTVWVSNHSKKFSSGMSMYANQ